MLPSYLFKAKKSIIIIQDSDMEGGGNESDNSFVFIYILLHCCFHFEQKQNQFRNSLPTKQKPQRAPVKDFYNDDHQIEGYSDGKK